MVCNSRMGTPHTGQVCRMSYLSYFQFFGQICSCQIWVFSWEHVPSDQCATFTPVVMARSKYVQPSDQLKDIMMLICQQEQHQEHVVVVVVVSRPGVVTSVIMENARIDTGAR